MKRLLSLSSLTLIMMLLIPAVYGACTMVTPESGPPQVYCDNVRVVDNSFPVAFVDFISPGWTPDNPQLNTLGGGLVVNSNNYNSYTVNGVRWFFNFSNPALSTEAYYFSLASANFLGISLPFDEPFRRDLIVDVTKPEIPELLSAYAYEANSRYYFKDFVDPVVQAEQGSFMQIFVDGSFDPPLRTFSGIYSPITPLPVPQDLLISSMPENEYANVTLENYDFIGNEVSVEYNFFLDTLAPSVVFDPGQGATVGSPTPELKFTFFDDGAGVNEESIIIDVSNGVDNYSCTLLYCPDFDLVNSDGVWTLYPNNNLNLGNVTPISINVSGSDNVGNFFDIPYSITLNTNVPYISNMTIKGGVNYNNGPFTQSTSPWINISFDSNTFVDNYAIQGATVDYAGSEKNFVFTVANVLSDGVYTLYLDVKKDLDPEPSQEITLHKDFIVDTTSPVLNVLTEPDVVANNFTLELEVTELNLKDIKVYLNNTLLFTKEKDDLTFVGNSYALASEINLMQEGVEGTNTFTIKVEDQVGLTTEKTLVMILDTKDPFINIASPDDYSATAQDCIDITGTAEYGSTVELTRGLGILKSTTVWETHEFTVSVDSNVNLSDDSLSIPYGSSVTIYNDNVFNEDYYLTVELDGESYQIYGKQSKTFENIYENSSIYVESNVNSNYNDTLSITTRLPNEDFVLENVCLTPGDNLLTLRAYDLAGRQAQTSLNVYYDSSAPIISFSNPEEGAVLGNTYVNVIATISDNYALNNQSLNVSLDGQLLSESEYSLTQVSNKEIKLSLARTFTEQITHTITVEVEDLVGRPASKELSFSVNDNAPSSPLFMLDDVTAAEFTSNARPVITVKFYAPVEIDNMTLTPKVPFNYVKVSDYEYDVVLGANLSDKNYNLSLYSHFAGVDSATLGGPYKYSFTVDTVSPTLTLSAPSMTPNADIVASYSWNDVNPDKIIFEGDLTQTLEISLEDKSPGTYSANLFLTKDTNNIKATIYDKAGNSFVQSVVVKWDNVGPESLDLFAQKLLVKDANLLVDGSTDADYLSLYIYNAQGLKDIVNITQFSEPDTNLGSSVLKTDFVSGDNLLTLDSTSDYCSSWNGKWLQTESSYELTRERYHILNCNFNDTDPLDPYIELTLSDSIQSAFTQGHSVYIFEKEHPSGYFSHSVTLEEGQNKFYAIAYDSVANSKESDKVISVTLDSIKPTITNVHPNSSEVVGTTELVVSAVVDGTNSDIDSLKTIFKFNGSIVNYDSTQVPGFDNSYVLRTTQSIPNEYAEYPVQISVTDNAGNSKELTWTVTANPTAPSEPEFDVEYGTEATPFNWYLNNDTLNITWTFDPSEKIRLSDIVFDSNSLTRGDVATGLDYQFNYITPVVDKTHTLSFTAEKLISEDPLTYGDPIERSVNIVVDNSPPTITQHPADEAVAFEVFDANIVSDEPANCRYSLSDLSYGQMSEMTSDDGVHHNVLVTLVPQSNTIYFKCADFAGNVNEDAVTSLIYYDSEKPYLTITGLSDGMKTNVQAHTVTVKAKYGTTFYVYRDGQLLTVPFKITQSSHELSINLVEIQNHLTFKVEDDFGRTKIVSMTVVYDGTDPIITLKSPVDSAHFGVGKVTVQVAYEDGYELDLSSIKLKVGNTWVYANNNPSERFDNGWVSYTENYGVGTYVIEASATDSLGNAHSEEWTFYVDDALPPQPQFEVIGYEPYGGQGAYYVVNTSEFDFTATFSEPVNLDITNESNYKGNFIQSNVNPTQTVYTFSGTSVQPLSNWSNIAFKAQLNEGNAQWHDVGSLFYQIDIEAPTLTIDAPSLTATPNVILNIDWVDDHMKTIEVSGVQSSGQLQPFTGTKGSIALPVVLKHADSLNTVVLKAIDYAGNSRIYEVDITWDNTAPASLHLYKPNEMYNMQTLQFYGYADPSETDKVEIYVYDDPVADSLFKMTTVTNIAGESTDLTSTFGTKEILTQEGSTLTMSKAYCAGLKGLYLQYGDFDPQVGRWNITSCQEVANNNYIILTVSPAPSIDLTDKYVTFHSKPVISGYFTGSVMVREGTNYISARAFDTAGGFLDKDYRYRVFVDSAPPIISAIEPPNGITIPGDLITIAALIDTTVTNLDYHNLLLDNVQLSNYISGSGTNWQVEKVVSDLDDGEHNVSLTVRDEAGNNAQEIWYFTVDPSAPSLVEFNVTNGTNHGDNSKWYLNQELAEIFMTFNSAEEVRVEQLSFDGALVTDYETLSGSQFKFSRLVGEDEYTTELIASKKYNGTWGRPVKYTMTLKADATRPVIVSVNPVERKTRFNPNQIEITVSENAVCRYSTSDVSYDQMSDVNVTGVKVNSLIINAPEGTTVYYFRCADMAGNEALNGVASQITYDSQVPPLIVNYVPNKTLISGCDISVSGISEYGANVTMFILGYGDISQVIKNTTEYEVTISNGSFSTSTLSALVSSKLTITNNDPFSYQIKEANGYFPNQNLVARSTYVFYNLTKEDYEFQLWLSDNQPAPNSRLQVQTSPLPNTFNFGNTELLYNTQSPQTINSIFVSAVDDAGNRVNDSWKFVICDELKPEVILNSPRPLTSVVQPNIELTVRDEYALDYDSIRLWVEGVEVTPTISIIDQYQATVSYTPAQPLIIPPSEEENISVRVTAYDNASNFVDSTKSFTIDLSDPAAPSFLIDGDASAYATTTSPVITTDFGNQIVFIDDVRFANVPGINFELLSNFSDRIFDYTPNSELYENQEYTFEVEAGIWGGGGSTANYSFTFKVDTLAPTISISEPISPLVTNERTVTVTGTCSDVNGIASVVLQQPGNIPVSVDCIDSQFTAEYVLSEITDAEVSTSIVATAFDLAGHSSSDTVEILLDKKSPVLSMQTSPNPAGATTIIVSISSSEELSDLLLEDVNGNEVASCSEVGSQGTDYECSFDAPSNFTGEFKLYATGTDISGNIGLSQTSVLIDTIAPQITNSQPRGFTNNKWNVVSASFSDQLSGVGISDNMEVKIDGLDPSSIGTLMIDSSGFKFVPSVPWENITHEVEVTVYDDVSNLAELDWTFTYDPNVPSTPTMVIANQVIGSDGRIYVPSTSAKISLMFSLVENIVVDSVKVDDQELLSGCQNSLNTWSCSDIVSDEAVHTVKVIARRELAPDVFSNPATFIFEFVTDTLEPVIDPDLLVELTSELDHTLTGTVQDYSLIDFRVKGDIVDSSVNIPAHASLDSIPFVRDISLTQSEGTKILTFTAVDEAGNVGTASISTSLDTSAPPLYVNPINTPVASNTISITGTSDQAATIYVDVENSNYEGSTTTVGQDFTLSGVQLSPKYNLITIWAENGLGMSSDEFTQQVFYDDVDPVIGLLQPQGTIANNETSLMVMATDEGSGIDPTSIVFTIDGEQYTISDPELTFNNGKIVFQPTTQFTEGSHSVFVEVADFAGRTAERSDLTFTIDLSVPNIMHDISYSIYDTKTPTLSFTFDDEVEITYIAIDGIQSGNWVTDDNRTFSFTPSWSLQDLPHWSRLNIAAKRLSGVGNEGSYGPILFGVDTTAPVLNFSIITPSPRAEPVIMISGSVEDYGTKKISFSGDIVPLPDIINPTSKTFHVKAVLLNEGENTITVEAFDKFRMDSESQSVVLDTTAPELVVTAIPNPAKAGDVQVSVEGSSDILPPVEVLYDGSFACSNQQSSFTCSTSVSSPSEGYRTVAAEAVDQVGNEGSGSFELFTDTKAPVVTGLSPSPNAFTNEIDSKIIAYFEDGTGGSGINPDSIWVTVNNLTPDQMGATLQKFANRIELTPAASWAYGEYTVRFSVSDYAENENYAIWSFMMDPTVPPEPTIAISDSVLNQGVLYSSTTSPTITISFDSEEQIVVSVVALESNGTIDITASCSHLDNVWTCPTTGLDDESLYTLKVVSSKSIGGGQYSAQVLNNYNFYVDSIAPELSMNEFPAILGNPLLSVFGTYREPFLDSFYISGDITMDAVNINEPSSWQNASFSSDVVLELPSGEKSVTVTAIDKAGHKTSITKTIQLHTLAPALDIDSIDKYVGTSTLNVTGLSDAYAEISLSTSKGYHQTVSVNGGPEDQDVNMFDSDFWDSEGNSLSGMTLPVDSTLTFTDYDSVEVYGLYMSPANTTTTFYYDGQTKTYTFDTVGLYTFELRDTSSATVYATLTVNVVDQQYDFVFGNVPVSPKFNMLTLFATDTRTLIESQRKNVAVYYDNVDPSITAPSPKGLTADTTPEISADVSDLGSGISNVTMYLDTELVASSYEGNSLTFTPDTELDEKVHTVLVEAVDNTNHKSSLSWQFELNTQIPLLVESPANKLFTSVRPELYVEFAEDVVMDSFLVDSGNTKVTLSSSTSNSFTYVSNNNISQDEHTLTFSAHKADGSGLRGDYGAYTFTIDSIGPNITVSPVNSPRQDRNFELIVTSTQEFESLAISGDILGGDVYDDGLYTDYYTKNLTLSGASGTKTVYVKAFDDAGNPSKLIELSIDLDMVGPEIVAFTIKDNNTPYPKLTVEFSEKTSVLSRLLYSSNSTEFKSFLTKINDTTFLFETESLDNGGYLIAFSVTDELGNEAVYPLTFNVATPDLNFKLVDPMHAVSPTALFDAKFSTDRYATCKYHYNSPLSYERMQNTMSGTGTTHIIYNMTLASEPKTVYVACLDEYGHIYDGMEYEFSLDTTPPVIQSLTANPAVVTTETYSGGSLKLVTELELTADEAVVCKLSNLTSNYTLMEKEFEGYNRYDYNAFTESTSKTINDMNSVSASYTYTVVCENLAGLLSIPTEVNFAVDLLTYLQIVTIFPTTGYAMNDNSIVLNISTNKPATCYYGINGDVPNNVMGKSDNDRQHIAYVNQITSDGTYNVEYMCTYYHEVATNSVTFVKDTTPPTTPIVEPQNVTCFLDELLAKWNSDEDLTKIDYYEYALGTNSGWYDLVNWTKVRRSKHSANVDNLNLTDQTSYYWSVKAVNTLGLESEIGTESVFVNLENPLCSEKVPPAVSIQKEAAQTGLEVTILCTDTESGCNPAKQWYGLSLEGIDCIPSESYLGPFIIDGDFNLCWQVYDNAGNYAQGSEFINVSLYISDNDNDGIPNQFDNCQDDYNPAQIDSDFDGIGDVCDSGTNSILPDGSNSDFDGDGILDVEDFDVDEDSFSNCEDPDDDNDGLCDTSESPLNNGSCVGEDNDDDEDGVIDRNERDTNNDLDNDGIPNGEDNDSDCDAILDCGKDIDDDNDGIFDWTDDDDDNDYVLDVDDPDQGGSDSTCAYSVSTPHCRDDDDDLDNDGILNSEDNDTDGDGLENCDDADSDNDGVPDLCDVDDDNDGIIDIFDIDADNDLDNDGILNDQDNDIDCDGILNVDDDDDDNDGIPDTYDDDANNNGINDDDEVTDSDGDGMPDDWEMRHGLDPYKDDSQEDKDSDQLVNINEYRESTNPRLADTDGDTFGDGVELLDGFDPLDPESYPRSSIIWTLLLIFGVLAVLGGGGYVGYTKYQEAKTPKPPMGPPGSRPGSPRPGPKPSVIRKVVGPKKGGAPKAAIASSKKEPSPFEKKLLEIQKKKSEEKLKKRDKIFDEFEKGKKKDIEKMEEIAIKDEKTLKREKRQKEDQEWVPLGKLTSGKDTGFDKLTSVIAGRNLEKHVKKAIKLPKNTKREDVFKELDARLDKRKIGSEVFDKLNEVSKIKDPTKKTDEIGSLLDSIIKPSADSIAPKSKKVNSKKVIDDLRKETKKK